MSTNQTIDGVRERLTEIANRDSAVSVSVRAEDLRALLDAPVCRNCAGLERNAPCPDCKPAAQPQGEPSHWANLAGQTITADLKAYNLKTGGAPAAACAAYSIPLYRHQAEPVPAEPILVEAVAVTRECDEDGLRLDWLVEGGIAALEHPGTMLLVAQGVLTNDSGNGYVYPARNPEDDE